MGIGGARTKQTARASAPHQDAHSDLMDENRNSVQSPRRSRKRDADAMADDAQSSPPAKRRGAGGASHAPAEDGAPASPAEDADGGAPAAGAAVEQATCPRCAWSFPADGAQARASEREAHEERMTGWWWKHQRLTFPMCRTEVLYGLICPCIWPYMSL